MIFREPFVAGLLAVILTLTAAACRGQPDSEPPVAGGTTLTTPVAARTQPATSSPQPDVPAPAAPEPVPPDPPSAPDDPQPAPVRCATEPVAVAPTREGLTRIGAKKCKVCHRVQFSSWAESAHASCTPPLDCESCHGSGSEYKGLKIMKDPERSRAAGLVDPDSAFCQERCHFSGWQDEMLTRAHAHQEN